MVSILLACNARNEHNIEEWIVYHKMKGFDKILIYDHLSTIPIQQQLSRPFEGVKIIRINAPAIQKIQLMTHTLGICRQLQIDYLFYIDADEFFYSSKYISIYQLLEDHLNHNNILMNWLIFGSNYLDDTPMDRFLLDTYTRSTLYLNRHIKSIVKVNQAVYAIDPHQYYMTSKEPKNIRKHVLKNVRISPINSPFCEEAAQIPFPVAHTFLAHFMYQSYNRYIERKINLPRDDNGQYRELLDKESFHTSANDVINICFQKDVEKLKQLRVPKIQA